MRKEYLYVDGYNIIHYWDILKDDLECGLEEVRNRLENILIEYMHLSGLKIILVYDGHMVKDNPGEIYEREGLQIVFTKEHETADSFIEKEIKEYGHLRRIRVATSDNMEQKIILGSGATRISARELYYEIEGEKNFWRQKLKREKLKNELKTSGLSDKNMEFLKNFLNNNGG